MTQSYGLPTVVPCQKNTVASWNQPEAGRQEDVGLNAGAADASLGDGNRETPQEFNLIWKYIGLTQARSTRGLQQNKGTKHYPRTALICFPSIHRHCSSQSASLGTPPHKLSADRFPSHGCGGLTPACRESDASSGWNNPYKHLLREWGWEKRSLFLTSEITVLARSCSVWVFHSFLICTLNQFFSVGKRLWGTRLVTELTFSWPHG